MGDRKVASHVEDCDATPSTVAAEESPGLPTTPCLLASASLYHLDETFRVISHEELQDRGGRTDIIWVAVQGAVFDLTNFKHIHPGGPEVLKMYSGTDATKAFEEVGHSDKAKLMARKRLIGVLEGHTLPAFARS